MRKRAIYIAVILFISLIVSGVFKLEKHMGVYKWGVDPAVKFSNGYLSKEYTDQLKTWYPYKIPDQPNVFIQSKRTEGEIGFNPEAPYFSICDCVKRDDVLEISIKPMITEIVLMGGIPKPENIDYLVSRQLRIAISGNHYRVHWLSEEKVDLGNSRTVKRTITKELVPLTLDLSTLNFNVGQSITGKLIFKDSLNTYSGNFTCNIKRNQAVDKRSISVSEAEVNEMIAEIIPFSPRLKGIRNIGDEPNYYSNWELVFIKKILMNEFKYSYENVNFMTQQMQMWDNYKDHTGNQKWSPISGYNMIRRTMTESWDSIQFYRSLNINEIIYFSKPIISKDRQLVIFNEYEISGPFSHNSKNLYVYNRLGAVWQLRAIFRD